MAKTTLRMLVMRLPADPDLITDIRVPHPGVALALIALGGAIGALLRAAVESLQPSSTLFPWTTVAINLSGSGLLALLLVVLEERFPTATWPRSLLATGLIGGYTTFSTFAVETVVLLRSGHGDLAVAYVATSVAGAVVSALAGLVLGRAAARVGDRDRLLRRARHAGLTEASEGHR